MALAELEMGTLFAGIGLKVLAAHYMGYAFEDLSSP